MAGRQSNGAEGDDILVMKLAAADGAILWQTTLGGPSRLDDRAWAIVVGTDDHPVFTGVAGTEVDPAYWVTGKLDGADGSEIWRRNVSGAVNHIDRRAGWLALCDDGDVVMASRTWAGAAAYDVVLHRYAADDGETLWATQYDSPQSGPDDPLHMVRDAAGDLLVAGNAGGDWMVLKFAVADGALVWATECDGPAGGYDAAGCVAEGPSGEVLAAGFTDGGASSWDVSTVAFDPIGGDVLWSMHHDAGDGQADEALSLVVGAAGDAYVIGYGYLLTTASDMLVLRYDLLGAAGVDPAAVVGARLPRLTAVPNPFARSVTLGGDGGAGGASGAGGAGGASSAHVALYDAMGRWVITLHDGPLVAPGWQVRWDGRDAAGRWRGAGVYFVRLESAAGTVTRKLVLAP